MIHHFVPLASRNGSIQSQDDISHLREPLAGCVCSREVGSTHKETGNSAFREGKLQDSIQDYSLSAAAFGQGGGEETGRVLAVSHVNFSGETFLVCSHHPL